MNQDSKPHNPFSLIADFDGDIRDLFAHRRDGELPAFWADPAKAKREMGWQTQLGIDRMCEDSWRWQSMNPDGFEG